MDDDHVGVVDVVCTKGAESWAETRFIEDGWGTTGLGHSE